MVSNFYIVHHEFKAGSASKWCDIAYAAMAPGDGYDDSVMSNKAKGFNNHFVNAITKEGPVYCIWEVRE
tara:strand:+ start:165 stop:371 length:207 start_codon:yes stop_codon:yes gene_type:complete